MRFFAIIFFSLFFFSCSFFNKDKPKKDYSRTVAKIGDNFLYESDLRGIIKSAPIKQDSSLLRQNFINNWIKEQLIYRKALSNLTDEEKDKKAELEEYYRSLIKYQYMNKIVEQRLSKNVTDAEIENYYEQNKEVFLLPRCLVKMFYVSLPKKSNDFETIKRWFKSDRRNDKDFLNQYCLNKSYHFSLDPEKWFYFDELAKEIPMKALDCANITPNLYYETNDSLSIYLLAFTEVKHEGSISPLKFEKDRIKNIILYKRRLDLIREIEDEIFKEGKQKNYYKIYE